VGTELRVVTAEDVREVAPGDELQVPPGAIVTPWARELAATRGVRLTESPRRAADTVVALGADHGGFQVKEELKPILAKLGWGVLDLGTHSTEAVDYPDFARAVALAVRHGRARFGIVVDGAGIGSCMAANKVRGVRAALCVDAAAARNAREHNDANVLTLGARFAKTANLAELLGVFLGTHCTEERHRRRVKKIMEIEERA
jgi:ribose 5-phosphate isomerase B